MEAEKAKYKRKNSQLPFFFINLSYPKYKYFHVIYKKLFGDVFLIHNGRTYVDVV